MVDDDIGESVPSMDNCERILSIINCLSNCSAVCSLIVFAIDIHSSLRLDDKSGSGNSRRYCYI